MSAVSSLCTSSTILAPDAARQRHVARELDGVAQTLLGVQQHGLARQRILAEPQRPAAALLRRHAASPPARLVFLKASPIIAEREQRQRLAEMDVRVVLAQRVGLAVARDRLVVPVERGERAAALQPRSGMLGSGSKHPLVRIERGGVAAEIVQSEAAIVVRHRMAGHDRQRRIELGDGFLGHSQRGVGDAAIDPRLGMLRHARQHLAEFGERFFGATETQKRVGMLIEHGDVVGVERARLIEACERLVVAFERMQDLTEIGPGAARARIDLDGGREQAMRFAHAAELRLDGAEHD